MRRFIVFLGLAFATLLAWTACDVPDGAGSTVCGQLASAGGAFGAGGDYGAGGNVGDGVGGSSDSGTGVGSGVGTGAGASDPGSTTGAGGGFGERRPPRPRRKGHGLPAGPGLLPQSGGGGGGGGTPLSRDK